MRVLIIDKDREVGSWVQKSFEEHGFLTDFVCDENEGKYLAVRANYQVVLLDTQLAGADFSVLQNIRRRTDVPVILMTRRDRVAHRMRGIELGAADYLIKPFSIATSIKCIEKVLVPGVAFDSPYLQVEDLEIDLLSRTCTRNRRKVPLAKREFAMLLVLLRKRGIILSESYLRENVWGGVAHGLSNVVEVTIGRLRGKIDVPFETKLIHTVRGCGYVFECRAGY